MRHTILAILAGLALSWGGCAFKRSDFVCGADGKPEGELSNSGKVAGAIAGGPRVRVNY